MNIFRKLLFPVALIYWLVTFIRNFLYDVGIFKSESFDIPIIAVGNLSVGGTGKSPQIEYLIRLLSDQYQVATLSRGYKRSTTGFVLADENANAKTLGDEPFQFYSKYPKTIVAVDENRVEGIEILLDLHNKPNVILLDDAFQHRKVKAGCYVLLTAYDDLFCDDFILPFGNLREPSFGKNRADMIIVTKCPNDIDELAQQKIKEKLNVSQPVYFTTIAYDENVYNESGKLSVNKIKEEEKVVVAGIAKPKPFFDFLEANSSETLVFSDHHNFEEKDIETILNKAKNNKIITTEKDYVRLKGLLPKDKLYYLPIQSQFINSGADFDKKIVDYVGKSSRNS
ncbi:tetraacyldisaccharide 4'-kinase [uncultured Flavobacterium sp.]|uniref:tetraacyldisaccharide 4'-kinase n=1 Tax=uncultured Flavobacterium sp. TaxID=165435 RepID=UPI0030C7F856